MEKIPGRPHPIDIHVGSRVRMRRTLVGMTQDQLGQALGITFQQVQKYERGTNRISASRLHDMACILGVPVSFFFEEMPVGQNAAPAQADDDADPMGKRETLELVRAYWRITDPRLRRQVYDLARVLADAGGGKE
ncbi:helix-turn-helix domain-containing protein [Telmatospirillum sp. J64-1]|uniref:helix-turn-helix domain-containing protein n=1 Tax=Telmatospirillum sp. J64-1 TaxID=2502183 RepID=UPI00115D157D|nr:helix-turn-helix transcriptional regulator [Telmatospirillum sp. J64-1]